MDGRKIRGGDPDVLDPEQGRTSAGQGSYVRPHPQEPA